MMNKLKPIIAAMCFLSLLNACQAESNDVNEDNKETTGMTENITQLVKNDTVIGEGREAEPGFMVSVHYTGWLYDENAPKHKGEKFDSSVDRGQPFEFSLGAGQVIQGWDQGFAGMKIGGKRTLIIPSEINLIVTSLTSIKMLFFRFNSFADSIK